MENKANSAINRLKGVGFLDMKEEDVLDVK